MWQMERGKLAIWRVPHKFWPQIWFTPTRHTPVHCGPKMAIFGNIFSSACLLCASAWKTPQALEKRFLGQDLSNAPTPTSIRCLNPEISIFNVWVSLAFPPPPDKTGASFKDPFWVNLLTQKSLKSFWKLFFKPKLVRKFCKINFLGPIFQEL